VVDRCDHLVVAQYDAGMVKVAGAVHQFGGLVFGFVDGMPGVAVNNRLGIP